MWEYSSIWDERGVRDEVGVIWWVENERCLDALSVSSVTTLTQY
jgi:hypothetical protein